MGLYFADLLSEWAGTYIFSCFVFFKIIFHPDAAVAQFRQSGHLPSARLDSSGPRAVTILQVQLEMLGSDEAQTETLLGHRVSTMKAPTRR